MVRDRRGGGAARSAGQAFRIDRARVDHAAAGCQGVRPAGARGRHGRRGAGARLGGVRRIAREPPAAAGGPAVGRGGGRGRGVAGRRPDVAAAGRSRGDARRGARVVPAKRGQGGIAVADRACAERRIFRSRHGLADGGGAAQPAEPRLRGRIHRVQHGGVRLSRRHGARRPPGRRARRRPRRGYAGAGARGGSRPGRAARCRCRRGRHRHRRHGVPVPRRTRPADLLASARLRRGCGDGRTPRHRPLERFRRPVACLVHRLRPGRLRRGDRPVRCAVLRNPADRSGADGPATADAAGDRMAGAGGRGDRSRRGSREATRASMPVSLPASTAT